MVAGSGGELMDNRFAQSRPGGGRKSATVADGGKTLEVSWGRSAESR